MAPLEAQKLIFNSIFDCLAAGQDRYKDLFFYMLDKIESLNELFSEEEIFLKVCQLANGKIKIDIFEKFLHKIKNSNKIFKSESPTTGNNLLHVFLKNKLDPQIIELFLDNINGDLSILNHPNKQGDTPLHYAVKHARKLDTVEVLLKHPVSLFALNKDKNTPFHYSVMLLTHNREFDPYILEQQILIFNRLYLLYNKEEFNFKNKYGNTVLHQMVADIDHYRGISNAHDGFTFEELLKNFSSRRSEFKRIYEFFQTVYTTAILHVTTKLSQCGLNLKEKNNLNFTAFQLAFIKKHYPAIKSLYSVGDTILENELNQNQFSKIALTLVDTTNREQIECLKIFIHSGGHVALRNTQLGHSVLKYALVDQLNIELTDLLVTKAGARILENGDSSEIWKSMFFKLNQNSDLNFKISTLQILFHIGVNYTRKDTYGRNAEDLARLYHIQEEYNQARKQFETYALIQIQPQRAQPTVINQQYFYH